jgi:hypothetical protein
METPHDPFEEPSCAFEHALVLTVHRDVSTARKVVADGPPLFSLNEWPDDVRKAFWALLRALETGTVRSDRYGEKVDPLVWRGYRDWLRRIESVCGQDALPSRVFIVEAENAMRGVRISTDDLRKLAESEKPAAPAGDVTKPSLAPRAQRDRPKKLTPVQRKTLVAHIRKKARMPGAPRGREVWQNVAEEFLGRRILREDVRAAIEEAGAKGKSGRPPKSGP